MLLAFVEALVTEAALFDDGGGGVGDAVKDPEQLDLCPIFYQ